MKKNIIILLLIILLPFLWAYINKTIYPNEQIQAKLIQQTDDFEQSIERYIELAERGEKTKYLQQYKKTRAAYKKIETYIVFRYPSVDKAINGGPVPSMTKDVVILHKDDPKGLQVIEELLMEKEPNSTELLKQLKLLQKKSIIIKTSLTNYPLQNWEVLEANHMAITKLITLSLSGFDSPVYLLSISDAIVVLHQLKQDIMLFKPYAQKSFNSLLLEKKLGDCIHYLKENNDFEAINRYEYYRDYLLPLQTQLKQLHHSTGYETYQEVSNIKRSIGDGEHLFSENYLNNYYSVRGVIPAKNQDQINLGRTLFFDPVLSKENNRACASCHSPDKAFADAMPKSIALDFKGTVKRNSPTLINSCFQSNFFWDLRSSDMNDQILNVILSHQEFNTTPDEVVEKLRQSQGYQQLFKKAFYAQNEPITIGTVKSSLEMYIRSLVNLNAKFDRNIRKEENSLSSEEIKGANLFLGKAACATCHFPPNFNGYVPPHYTDTEGEILGTTATPKFEKMDGDMGMYERFKNSYPEADYIKGMFKTPTIRNVAFTAPYMHHGMYESLEQVVNFTIMEEVQEWE